jgi:hypothetical protein
VIYCAASEPAARRSPEGAIGESVEHVIGICWFHNQNHNQTVMVLSRGARQNFQLQFRGSDEHTIAEALIEFRSVTKKSDYRQWLLRSTAGAFLGTHPYDPKLSGFLKTTVSGDRSWSCLDGFLCLDESGYELVEVGWINVADGDDV